MQEEKKTGILMRAVQKIDSYIRPSQLKYKPACLEDKELLMDCVTQSKCYSQSKNFVYCVQDGADPECKAIRYNYFLCKRSQVFWAKAFSRQDNRSI